MTHDPEPGSTIPGCGRRHLTWIGAIWGLPDTLVGLGFAALSAAVPRPSRGLLVAVTDRGLAHRFLTRRGFGAITFGRVVISTTSLGEQTRMHEEHHARQYEVLGPFFLPIYLWLHARQGYADNALEREAVMCSETATYEPTTE